MTPTERAAKVAEIKQELASRSIPGRDRENIRALLAIVAELGAEVEKLREALLHISNSHLGDCPAAFDELAHAKTHIGRLLKLALDALTASERAAKAAS